MDIGKILVGAVVAAALMLVGVRMWNRDVPESDSLPIDGRVASDDAQTGKDAGAPASGEIGASGDRRSTGANAESAPGPFGAHRPRPSAAERLGVAVPGGAGDSGRSGGAPGGTGRTSGSTGSSVAGGGSTSGAGSVSFGAVPGERGGVERSGRRSEIVDILASQQPAARVGGEPTGEGGEDVVLSVPLERTTEAEDGTKPIVEEDVDVSEDGVGISFKEGSVLQFPNAGNANGDAGSISFQIAPNWAGYEESSNSFVQIRDPNSWANTLKLGKNGRYLRFILTDSGGVETDISAPIDSWQPGESQDITVTWGEAETAMYVNGKRVGWNTYPNQLVFRPNTPMYLGADLPGGASSANATIQNFKVYGRRLTQDEVQR